MVGVDFEAQFTFDRLKLELQSMERQWKGNEVVFLSKKTNRNVIEMVIMVMIHVLQVG